jgi:predicted negative regulator of RcsB-dependent stress response
MPRTRAFIFLCFCLVGPLCAENGDEAPVLDPYFGEALYEAQQGLYFDALETLDAELGQHYSLDEPYLDSLNHHIGDAEFSVGDFELRYRMHHRAGRAIKAVLEGDVDEQVRNEAAYRLATIHFQKSDFEAAMEALDRIHGDVPDAIVDDIAFLQANILLATGQADAAADVLQSIDADRDLEGFAAYNLGIALLEAEQQKQGFQQLDRAGRLGVSDEAQQSIRDRSNLVLGSFLLEAEEYQRARGYLDRVRLDGPYSNQALLSSGWASMSAEDYATATVPWSILAQRNVTDIAVQEALLSLPFAYSELELHGRAAENFARALDNFVNETQRLEASVESIRDGKFLEALVREEIRQDDDWVIRLRELPESPETYYLMELLASHEFQTGLRNYLDLEELRKKLVQWQGAFTAYEEMVQIRREHYEPLLPGIDDEFRSLDSRMKLRLEQQKMLSLRLQAMLNAPRPDLLATRGEQQLLTQFERIDTRLRAQGHGDDSELLKRNDRLRGLVNWKINTSYYERLDKYDRHLREINAAIMALQVRYDQFVRVRQAASHSYQGYLEPIARMRMRVDRSLQKVDSLMASQGRLLEWVAVEELTARLNRLEQYKQKARYALADSYDRATQARAQEGM